jgi:hypothetical protein
MLAQTYYQCLGSAITIHFKPLIPPRFSIKNHDMCDGMINSNMIGILVPYRLPMGS